MVMRKLQRAAIRCAIGVCFALIFLAIAGSAPVIAQQAGGPPPVPQQEDQNEAGIIGIIPAISADTVGAPARLMVRGVAPDSPAHFACIEPGDQIVAVDGKPVEGQKLSDVIAAIRGEVGTAVKLALSRHGQAREVSLTRVAPGFEHHGHHMGGHRDFEDHGMMGGHRSPNE